jgi:hypothetical protein
MQKRILPLLGALLFLLLFENCTDASQQSSAGEAAKTPALSAAPANYWFQGKAEIARYKVEQERYGEMRAAQQIMVFVTEDFSARKQVKLDDPEAAGADRVPVLKVNMLRRFVTGIYDYSLMLSVFTPFDQQKPKPSLKVTTTVQDWCGHVFSQFNRTDSSFLAQTFSYFETEGDHKAEIKPDFLEDEIWTLLRLNPAVFTDRQATVVPSSVYLRLRHKELKAENAHFTIQNNGNTSALRLAFEKTNRQLSITFETAFPHRILGWEETVDAKLVSRGALENISMHEYWREHDNIHESLRKEIGLQWF